MKIIHEHELHYRFKTMIIPPTSEHIQINIIYITYNCPTAVCWLIPNINKKNVPKMKYKM